MGFITLGESTTETIPINLDTQTNSSLSNDNTQGKNENSSAVESDVINGETTTESSQSTFTNDASTELLDSEDSIKIRLKYLNDNCRLVKGRLQENIGVFKRYYLFCTK